jgi:hypothetical protein
MAVSCTAEAFSIQRYRRYSRIQFHDQKERKNVVGVGKGAFHERAAWLTDVYAHWIMGEACRQALAVLCNVSFCAFISLQPNITVLKGRSVSFYVPDRR